MRTIKIILSLCLTLFAALIFYAWQVEPGFLRIKSVSIKNPFIKKDCTIVFMADLHLPVLKRLEGKLVDALIKIKPDIILIGGDFSSKETPTSYALEKLTMLARYGKVIMVMGNNDLCGWRQCVYCATKYPIDRLNRSTTAIVRNDSVVAPELGIKVFGLDDPVTNNDDTLCIASAPGPYCNILLLHSVYKLTADQKRRFDVICSGHSHGGQFFFLKPFLHALDPTIDRRYTGGLYMLHKTVILVTTGLGESFLPLRMGVPPEIMVIHVRKKEE